MRLCQKYATKLFIKQGKYIFAVNKHDSTPQFIVSQAVKDWSDRVGHQ